MGVTHLPITGQPQSGTGAPSEWAALYSPFKAAYHTDRIEALRRGEQPNPVHLHFVVSDYCNHDCPWCAYRVSGYSSNEMFAVDGNHNPQRFLPAAKIREVLDDCKDMGVRGIEWTGGGEPTIHPQFRESYQHGLDLGLACALVTNGTTLHNFLDLAVRSAWLRVSVDAGSAETYAAVRRVRPALFARPWEAVRALADMRAVPHAPELGVGFVVLRENWREVVRTCELARDAGADNVRINALYSNQGLSYYDGILDEIVAACAETAALSTPAFRVFNEFGPKLADLLAAPEYARCGIMQFSTYIGADQNVYTCCVYAYNRRGLIGSIADQRFRDLWASQAKRAMFAGFDARGCSHCYFNPRNRFINYLTAPSRPPHVEFV